jgi:hypothetical protein
MPQKHKKRLQSPTFSIAKGGKGYIVGEIYLEKYQL